MELTKKHEAGDCQILFRSIKKRWSGCLQLPRERWQEDKGFEIEITWEILVLSVSHSRSPCVFDMREGVNGKGIQQQCHFPQKHVSKALVETQLTKSPCTEHLTIYPSILRVLSGTRGGGWH